VKAAASERSPVKRTAWCFFFFLLTAILRAGNASAQNIPRVVHVFVALADNAHQGIVPVPAALGNGDDPDRNLYWGAAFGVKTFFNRSQKDWAQLGQPTKGFTKQIAERVVYRHWKTGTLLIADAYRGNEIRQAISDFLSAAADSERKATFNITDKTGPKTVEAKADLVVYVGHDGLMDFPLEKTFSGDSVSKRQAIVLACASKQYFGAALKPTGAEPLLWTTNLMAPEAYTLKAALDGWIAGETNEQIRQRAAGAYAQYQRISEKAALKLFATGW